MGERDIIGSIYESKYSIVGGRMYTRLRKRPGLVLLIQLSGIGSLMLFSKVEE